MTTTDFTNAINQMLALQHQFQQDMFEIKAQIKELLEAAQENRIAAQENRVAAEANTKNISKLSVAISQFGIKAEAQKSYEIIEDLRCQKIERHLSALEAKSSKR